MSQINPNTLPPNIVDMFQVIRNQKEDQNYRENVAARLSIIVEAAEAELRRFRSEKPPVRRKKVSASRP